MSHDLEYPGAGGSPDWDLLYRARGSGELVSHRMLFTGDVVSRVLVRGIENPRTRTVMLLQHPWALRSNGVELLSRLVVAEVRPFSLLEPGQWRGHFDKMPLPFLVPDANGPKRHQAAFFASPYLVAAADLDLTKRIASLSPMGVNILLQRWVAHNSRVIVPTFEFQKMVAGPYEEADLIEEWCQERVGSDVTVEQASKEALDWLRADLGDGVPNRQTQLADAQRVSKIRRDMRAALRAM